MSNSFELLTGPIETIQKKYEVLSDIVSWAKIKAWLSNRAQRDLNFTNT